MFLVLNGRFIDGFEIDSWTIAFAGFRGQGWWSFPRSLLLFVRLCLASVVAGNPLEDFVLDFAGGSSSGGTAYMANNNKNYGA